MPGFVFALARSLFLNILKPLPNENPILRTAGLEEYANFHTHTHTDSR